MPSNGRYWLKGTNSNISLDDYTIQTIDAGPMAVPHCTLTKKSISLLQKSLNDGFVTIR
jgi:hypothetical protein